MLAVERISLRALPCEPFDASEQTLVRVDSKAMVTVRQNRYSVPSELLGRRVGARVGARRIEILSAGTVIATHERLRGCHQVRAQLGHYAGILARKPGALAGSVALAQERERGEWPACFDEMWRAIEERATFTETARQMVDVVQSATLSSRLSYLTPSITRIGWSVWCRSPTSCVRQVRS